jgi:hypothetical protein
LVSQQLLSNTQLRPIPTSQIQSVTAREEIEI